MQYSDFESVLSQLGSQPPSFEKTAVMARLLTEMDEASGHGAITVDQKMTLYRIMAVVLKNDVAEALPRVA